ncbi:MAG: hypothetical protein P4M11_07080 [Candidatus Pacebacteria bacterium]|nr:hypothetical protein [Candidatus Paceibacterota bacterium]
MEFTEIRELELIIRDRRARKKVALTYLVPPEPISCEEDDDDDVDPSSSLGTGSPPIVDQRAVQQWALDGSDSPKSSSPIDTSPRRQRRAGEEGEEDCGESPRRVADSSHKGEGCDAVPVFYGHTFLRFKHSFGTKRRRLLAQRCHVMIPWMERRHVAWLQIL